MHTSLPFCLAKTETLFDCYVRTVPMQVYPLSHPAYCVHLTPIHTYIYIYVWELTYIHVYSTYMYVSEGTLHASWNICDISYMSTPLNNDI